MFPKPGLFPKESLEMRQELNFIQMFNSLYNNIFEINLMLLLYGMLGKLVTFICSSHFFLQSLKFLSRGVELVPGPGMMQSFWILAKKFLCSRLLISVMQCTHYNVLHSGQIIRTIYGSIFESIWNGNVWKTQAFAISCTQDYFVGQIVIILAQGMS